MSKLRIIAISFLIGCNSNHISNISSTSIIDFDSSSSSSFGSSSESSNDSSSESSTTFDLVESSGFESTSTTDFDLKDSSTSLNSDFGDSLTTFDFSECNQATNSKCNVFVSSASIAPDIGVIGFNDFCTKLACDAGICGNYHALIKGNGNFWGFSNYKGDYQSPSGIVVATKGNLETSLPFIENEFGVNVPPDSKVFTGFSSLFNTCPWEQNPWKSNKSDQDVNIGFVGGLNKTWYTTGYIKCSEVARVYCVEIPE